MEWRKIIRFRDLISHHYEKVQEEIIFEICKTFIPNLKVTIDKMIRELG